MSTIEEIKPTKRRGRPPKAPEDKIQDLNAYKREWHAAHKDDEHVIAIKRKHAHDRHRREKDLYTFMQHVVRSGIINSLDSEQVEKLKTLTMSSDF